MKKRYVNLTLLVIAVALLATAAFFVKIRPVADRVAVLKAAGMTCSSCVSAIEKALQKKNGVASVEVDVNRGWVTVGYDSKSVGTESIAAAVAAAGYPNNVQMMMSVEQYERFAGKTSGEMTRSAGCGGGCCN